MTEIWDIYDENGVKTGRTHKRGEPVAPGDYHLVVIVWIKNSQGCFLISKRAPNIPGAGLWQCTGGAAVSGDDSLTAALREAEEEVGVILNPSKGRLMYRRINDCALWDVWLFNHDIDIEDIVLQEGETCDAKWVTVSEIWALYNSGEFAQEKADLLRVFRDVEE